MRTSVLAGFLAGLGLFISCEKSFDPIQRNCPCEPQKNSLNLIFKVAIGAWNVLDTFECTFTKDMVLDPSITICFALSPAELDSIRARMNQIDFFNYPDTFRINIPDSLAQWITPSIAYYYYVETDTIRKELFWHDYIINPDEDADKLRELGHFIMQLVMSKDEYKRLPEPRGGYL
jgi:hypothetical protein